MGIEPTPAAGAIATTSQTAGPYWHLIDFPEWADTTRHFAATRGERIVLRGRVTDGEGAPVTDAMVEIWHADPDGAYPDADAPTDTFQGYGRCRTDARGEYRFVTLKPGPVAASAGVNARQAPHVALTLFARGLLRALSTRLYFEGESLNDTDPVLNAVPPGRRGTLVARRDGTDWRLDIRLQGGDETVFLHI